MAELMTQFYIEIPEDKIPAAVEAAYDLSTPAGMGFVHFKPGPLDEGTRNSLIRSKDLPLTVYMDYVHGRQCKFQICQHEGRFYTHCMWYDHSQEQLVELLNRIGVEDAAAKVEAALTALDAEYV